MNYRSHFQNTILQIQRQLDRAMYAGNWGEYLHLRHRMIEIKTHIVEHEARCGYECECQPEPEWSQIINSSITGDEP